MVCPALRCVSELQPSERSALVARLPRCFTRRGEPARTTYTGTTHATPALQRNPFHTARDAICHTHHALLPHIPHPHHVAVVPHHRHPACNTTQCVFATGLTTPNTATDTTRRHSHVICCARHTTHVSQHLQPSNAARHTSLHAFASSAQHTTHHP